MANVSRATTRALVVGVMLSLLVTTVALAVLGDVNNDGSINGTDAQWVLESVVGTRTLTASQEAAADVDGDGDADAADAQMIRQFVGGSLGQFPVRVPFNSSPIAITRKGEMVGVVNPDSDSVTF